MFKLLLFLPETQETKKKIYKLFGMFPTHLYIFIMLSNLQKAASVQLLKLDSPEQTSRLRLRVWEQKQFQTFNNNSRSNSISKKRSMKQQKLDF